MSKFNGFEGPKQNWSKLPHQLIDALPQIKTLGEMKIILYTLRHTWGFKDDYKKITLNEFQYGRKRRDGKRLDSGTGLTKPTIINGIKRAISHGFLFEYVDTSDPARVKKFYSLAEEGLKVFTPEVKKFYPRGKETLHRTEKETLEKETLDISPLAENKIHEQSSGDFGNPTNGDEPILTDPEPDALTEAFGPIPDVRDGCYIGKVETGNGKPTISEADQAHLLTFGHLPDDKPPWPFDTIQEIRQSGWEIWDPTVERGLAYCLEAIRTKKPDFAVPNNTRSDWHKDVRGHLKDYKADDLGTLYKLAVDKLEKAGMSYTRPGSLTRTLPDVANASAPTNTGPILTEAEKARLAELTAQFSPK